MLILPARPQPHRQGVNRTGGSPDGLGSPVALINQSGGQTAAYAYDPYGQSTATAVGGSTAVQYQIYGYAGGFDDPTSTLVHYGKRWYDPATGRWTQQDSMETLADPSRANRYEYASSDPINEVDPTGQAPFSKRTERLCAAAVEAWFVAGGTFYIPLWGEAAIESAIVATTACIGSMLGDQIGALFD